MLYQFGKYELDVKRAELMHEGKTLKLESKVYLLLEILLTHHDRVVTKDEIAQHVWAGRIVSDGSIDNTISAARKAIGDDGKTQRLIKTFTGTGLRFVGDVTVTGEDAIESTASTTPLVEVAHSIPTPHSAQKWISWGIAALAVVALTFVGVNLLSSKSNNNAANNTQPIRSNIQEASIAVLPFADMSAEGNQQYLGDGIAEELLNVLTNVGGLNVASRTSAFSFRDKTVTIGEIGEALQVAYVLEGSIRKSDTTLRITAQLIDTRTDKHVWSETYNRTFTAKNLLEIQDDISARIVSQMHLELDISGTNTEVRPKSVEAYELFLRAQALMREKKPEEIRRAEMLYKQVIELEPSYAPAYSGLVQTYKHMSFYANMGLEEAANNMRPYVDRGMALAPGRPETLVAAGEFAALEYRYEDAILLFERAVTINPKYVYAYEGLGSSLSLLGRGDDALKAYEKALPYDPISPALLGNISDLRYKNGYFEGALEAAQTNLKWNGDAAQALNMMARLLSHNADYAGAHELLIRAAKINPHEFFVQTDLSNLYLDIGLDQHAIEAAKLEGVKANAYAITGQPEKAMELARHDPNEYYAAYAAYLLSDYDFAYTLFVKEVASYGLTEPGSFTPAEGHWLAVYAYVLKQQGDGDAEILLNNLEKALQKLTPTTTKFPDENLGAAALYMMRGDPDEALRWLDPIIDKGHVYLKLTSEPIFAPLANHPGYAARLKRMQINAKKYRTAIEKQL